VHQGLRDRAFAKDHELSGETIGIRDVEPNQETPKQSVALLLVRDGDLVGGVRWVRQLRNGIHEGTTAVAVAPHRELESIVLAEIIRKQPGTLEARLQTDCSRSGFLH
jgi:hypothetical protein